MCQGTEKGGLLKVLLHGKEIASVLAKLLVYHCFKDTFLCATF